MNYGAIEWIKWNKHKKKRKKKKPRVNRCGLYSSLLFLFITLSLFLCSFLCSHSRFAEFWPFIVCSTPSCFICSNVKRRSRYESKCEEELKLQTKNISSSLIRCDFFFSLSLLSITFFCVLYSPMGFFSIWSLLFACSATIQSICECDAVQINQIKSK